MMIEPLMDESLLIVILLIGIIIVIIGCTSRALYLDYKKSKEKTKRYKLRQAEEYDHERENFWRALEGEKLLPPLAPSHYLLLP